MKRRNRQILFNHNKKFFNKKMTNNISKKYKKKMIL